MDNRHTPGPWHRNIKPARKFSTIFAGRNTHIARLATQGLADDEIEANCNLIAAAPDMLAALERIGIELCLHSDANEDKTKVRYCLDLADAAVAKAKGES